MSRKYRGKFDLSHEFKFTCNMGEIIPVNFIETVPSDKMVGSNQALVKLLALLAPVMHQVDIYFRSFYIPNRLVWKNWDDFITGGKDGNAVFEKPYIILNNVEKGSIFEYIYGSGVVGKTNIKVDSLPLRIYNLIINEFFHDQYISTPLTVNLEDGEDDMQDYSIQHVLWEKDYFTTGRPKPQAGTGATLPLGASAPVVGNGKPIGFTNGVDNRSLGYNDQYLDLYGRKDGANQGNLPSNGVTNKQESTWNTRALVGLSRSGDQSNVFADLSNATSVPLETVREAFKIQSYLEKLLRVGHHMTDWLYGFFGVRASDARLQRPEYLGGSKVPLFFSEVLQTSETSSTPLGTQAGHSTTFANSKIWKKFVEEYGWIATFMYIKPKSNYMQGLARKFTRETKFDYYLPEFATLGEQGIKEKELYLQGNAEDEEIFAFNSRYQEMRGEQNRVAGEFADQLKYYHLARDFENKPELNEEFLKCVPSKRIYATSGYEQQVLVQCANLVKATRPLPRFVTPATLN